MYNSNMNVLKKRKDEKIINKILKNHFEEFKLKYWNKVRREMREQIENTVTKALNCGNIEKGYIKHKCIDCG
ncbi:MAG: transposase zinc-binding domain-containing protein, partial [Peptacetobacter sp.]